MQNLLIVVEVAEEAPLSDFSFVNLQRNIIDIYYI